MKAKTKKNLPFFLLSLVASLVLLGFLMIYNASSFESYRIFGNKYHFLRNQAIWGGVGFLGLSLASFFDYKRLKIAALPLLVFNFFLLLIVLIPGVGVRISGARRWISFGNFFGGREFLGFQPSELLKLCLSLYLAAWLEEKRPILPFLIVIFVLLFLLILQPDLGTGVVIVASAFFVYFVSGAPIKKLLFFSFFALLLGLGLIFSSEYRRNRILTFLDPSLDPLGKSYHMQQILIALGSGGFWGLGLGQSRQKYQYLPEATTDSIFAVIAEEVGFLGASFLVLFYLLLIFLGFKVVRQAKDRFGQLLACSLTTWLGLQAFVNFSAMVSLLPLTGIPLPFISYGGSSLVVAMVAVGILINIARQS